MIERLALNASSFEFLEQADMVYFAVFVFGSVLELQNVLGLFALVEDYLQCYKVDCVLVLIWLVLSRVFLRLDLEVHET